jgi:hypothetical protein
MNIMICNDFFLASDWQRLSKAGRSIKKEISQDL